ncbi:MAG TPA: hypothetical protein VIT90_07950 [Lysobacter sp.]
MTNYVCRYPDGSAGLGLLIVRTCYATVAFGVATLLPDVPVSTGVLYATAGLVALLLAIGLATRWVALILGVAVVAALSASGPVQQLLLAGHVGGCLAIALLGPGAFSLDARHHGRRVILLQTHTPDPGDDD